MSWTYIQFKVYSSFDYDEIVKREAVELLEALMRLIVIPYL